MDESLSEACDVPGYGVMPYLQLQARLAAAAYNLLRIGRLSTQAAEA